MFFNLRRSLSSSGLVFFSLLLSLAACQSQPVAPVVPSPEPTSAVSTTPADGSVIIEGYPGPQDAYPITDNSGYPAPQAGNQAAPLTPPPTIDPSLLIPTTDIGVVVGNLVSSVTSQPLTVTEVWLAEAYPEAESYVLNTSSSPATVTDLEGNFAFPRIEPGIYVVIVGNPFNQYKVVQNEELKPKVWTVTAGQVLDLGTLDIALPVQ